MDFSLNKPLTANRVANHWFSLILVAALVLAVSVLMESEFVLAEDAARQQPPHNFENDIIPILTKFGCNNSGCHGKAEGQNGFKLSVFGFDPQADHLAIVSEGRGRRIFPGSPDRSLFLLKASGGLPHGGGVRLVPERPEYQTLLDWITQGARFGSADDPHIKSIDIIPASLQLGMGRKQQLKVQAAFSDGRQLDVTNLATFQSNNEGLATVDENGLVTIGQSPGDVAVMATYLGQVDVLRALIPIDGGEQAGPPTWELVESNFIDRHIYTKLRKLNIVPSPAADDTTFLRRVFLDLIGTLPTAEEVRQFLDEPSASRRARAVDRLLERREYADYWALKWADLLRVNRLELGRKRAYLYYHWIHDSFAENKRLDQFATELLTAEGPISEEPAGNFYKVVKDPKQMASTLSQALLGVRVECAQCHHHPYDRWSQDDYCGMLAVFTEVEFKSTTQGEVIVNSGRSKTFHPRTNQEVLPRALGEMIPLEFEEGQRRRQFASWLTHKDNPYFAKNMANRLWAHLMGRGLVEPVDDVRMTNPASHPELLEELADYLKANDFNQHALLRLIVASQTYQRSAEPSAINHRDELNYSRYPLKQLEAEVLLDAVCQATGVGEKFSGVPEGSRAIQLWDSHVSHYFLQIFGRPMRATACECERASEPTVSQVLHFLNAPEIQAKLSHAGGYLAKLSDLDDDRVIDELYLSYFSRFPSEGERLLAQTHLTQSTDRRQGLEDLAWSMLNCLEFLFNH